MLTEKRRCSAVFYEHVEAVKTQVQPAERGYSRRRQRMETSSGEGARAPSRETHPEAA